jgi:hypothetical protein
MTGLSVCTDVLASHPMQIRTTTALNAYLRGIFLHGRRCCVGGSFAATTSGIARTSRLRGNAETEGTLGLATEFLSPFESCLLLGWNTTAELSLDAGGIGTLGWGFGAGSAEIG